MPAPQVRPSTRSATLSSEYCVVENGFNSSHFPKHMNVKGTLAIGTFICHFGLGDATLNGLFDQFIVTFPAFVVNNGNEIAVFIMGISSLYCSAENVPDPPAAAQAPER